MYDNAIDQNRMKHIDYQNCKYRMWHQDKWAGTLVRNSL